MHIQVSTSTRTWIYREDHNFLVEGFRKINDNYIIVNQTMLNQRAKLLSGWKQLPENKPPWETWKRLVSRYHNEAFAWSKWVKSQEKKNK
jgi:hypothetical protein